MKFAFLLVSLYLSLGYSNASSNNISLILTDSQQNIAKLLKPLWNDLQYNYQWSNKSLGGVADIVKAQLVKADLRLANHGRPLFDAKTERLDNLKLQWHLDQVDLDALIKVQFQFRQYGVKITHNEYFKLNASNIKKAQSNLKIVHNSSSPRSSIHFDNIQHNHFEFSQVKVVARDGIGNVLRFIFDNIFSKRKVEDFLKDKINQELENWINQNELITKLQQNINNQLYRIHTSPWRPNNLPWNIYPHLDLISLNDDTIQVNSSYLIDTTQANVHSCATGMLQKNDMTVTSSMIENIINNLATYEVFRDGKLQEPLFCMGYKDYDDEGNPLGENATIHFLNRNIVFNYWIRPNQVPHYNYDFENDMITINLNLQVKIQGKGYPRLRAINDTLNAILSFKFKIEYIPYQGLQMKFIELNIQELLGTIKVKWFPYTPWFRIATDRIRRELEESLNKELNDNYSEIPLISEQIDISENFQILLREFDLNQKGLQFLFDLELR